MHVILLTVFAKELLKILFMPIVLLFKMDSESTVHRPTVRCFVRRHCRRHRLLFPSQSVGISRGVRFGRSRFPSSSCLQLTLCGIIIRIITTRGFLANFGTSSY